MAKWKQGDRVKVISREVSGEDHLSNSYYSYMAGLPGTVQNVYNDDEIAVKLDIDALPNLISTVHTEATKRMRAKFLDGLSEEARRKLSAEEKKFDANYVVLVKAKDLEKGPAAPKPVAKQVEEEDDDFDGTSVVQGVLYDDPEIRETEVKRLSAEDLAIAEAEELKRRSN